MIVVLDDTRTSPMGLAGCEEFASSDEEGEEGMEAR
jgi:hypothetical protein